MSNLRPHYFALKTDKVANRFSGVVMDKSAHCIPWLTAFSRSDVNLGKVALAKLILVYDDKNVGRCAEAR